MNILQSATLIKRYKRFLADVELENGELLTIYCPNTGAMTHCADPGDQVWYSTSDNPKRKYKYTWELTYTQAGHWICINSVKANYFIGDMLKHKKIPELAEYNTIEVKSCTLLESCFGEGAGFFPDAVSKRGQKHLRELIEMKHQGFRSVLIFAVLHSGITSVQPAKHIDKHYAALFELAKQQGVEVICCFPAFKALLF